MEEDSSLLLAAQHPHPRRVPCTDHEARAAQPARPPQRHRRAHGSTDRDTGASLRWKRGFTGTGRQEEMEGAG